MMPERTRLKWLGPLLVLVVVAVVVLSVAVGAARGDTATTLTASPTDAVASEVGLLSPAAEPIALAPLTIKAGDLGIPSSKAPAIKSPAAVVVNADTGRVLYEWDAYKRRPMASTTKIMTAILILENLPLDREVTVSEKAANTSEPKALLRAGDVATVEQLMYALMIRSSNGAAVALAEACDGTVGAFLERMNARAEQLGMADTHFMNPSGLDADGHYSTAADMAKVAVFAMRDARFREFASTPSYNLELPGRSEPILLKNTNKLLGRVEWVTGIKTGLTPRAEQCLVGSATRDGVSVISVVLGQPTPETCWDETQTLLDYGLRQFRHVTLLKKGTAVAESHVPYQADGVIRLVTQDTLETDLYKEDEVTTLVKLERPLALPIEAGDRLGEVLLSVDGETVQSVALVADRSFGEITLGAKIAYFWDRVTGWFGA